MKLTKLQYGVIMQAIGNAKAEIADDTFIDQYDNENEYTNEELGQALMQAEEIIMNECLPLTDNK